ISAPEVPIGVCSSADQTIFGVLVLYPTVGARSGLRSGLSARNYERATSLVSVGDGVETPWALDTSTSRSPVTAFTRGSRCVSTRANSLGTLDVDLQIIEQALRVSQIGSCETFGESLVGVAQQPSSFFAPALLVPKPAQPERGSQPHHRRFHFRCGVQCSLEPRFGFNGVVARHREQEVALELEEL